MHPDLEQLARLSDLDTRLDTAIETWEA